MSEENKDEGMTKLGVDESGKGDKTASEGCPECGAKVEKHGNISVCPKHGTAPFEGK
jgi:uncharacterized Zn finger protein (UPF0148 family)